MVSAVKARTGASSGGPACGRRPAVLGSDAMGAVVMVSPRAEPCTQYNHYKSERLSSVYSVRVSMDHRPEGPQAQGGAAFLLAQLGSHAARLFADRIAALDLTPPQAG